MNELFSSVYHGKRVLVTGHTGFVGGWLCLWLKELGAKVAGYSLAPPTKPCLFESVNLAEKLDRHTLGDIRDFEQLIAIFQEYRPQIVFHLAAQPLVKRSYKEPKYTYETNVIGTANVLEAVRNTTSVKACVIVTSDKCYENKEWFFGYREIDPIGGDDPYSSSKGCAELVTMAYTKSFFNSDERGRSHGIAVSSVRAGNIIGGGDWAQDRLIPDCVRALSRNRKVLIRNPQATRPWQFVLEPLSGYLWLGAVMYQHGEKYTGAWNLGPSDSTTLTVGEVVRLFIEQWGYGDYEISKMVGQREVNFLKLDTSKADSLLKWKPVYCIFDAIRETAEWYRKFYFVDSVNILDLTLSQIDRYIEEAKKQCLLWTEDIYQSDSKAGIFSMRHIGQEG